jgi:stress-induced morphogen
LPYALDFVKLSPVKLTPCLLTLTQVKIKGERLSDSVSRLMTAFRKFIRHSFFGEYFSGGIYAIENTVSDEGNHSHLHVVVFRKKFIDHTLLKQHWAMVSSGAENLNIKRIDVLESGLKECIKYISKPIPADALKREHVKEILELKGQRMIDRFGDFRKFCLAHELPEVEAQERPKLESGQYCASCNDGSSELFQLTMTMPDLIAFHRRIEQTRASPPTIHREKKEYHYESNY